MAPLAPSIAQADARDHAFERLYRRYVQDVYRYTLALLRNPADAEEVTQTTFMNAYRAWARGEQIEKPHNWLIRIAHNAARTKYARSLRRVQEVPLDDAVAELAVPEEDKPEVAEVLAALGELPFNQRAALVMRELEGRSYAEISQTLGVSQSAVEALIFRARRSLRLSRSALNGLTLVQLPNSLSSFFDGPMGAVTGGGALLGGGVLLKAAVFVAAGAVAAGVGYTSVGATTDRTAPPQGKIHPFRIRSLQDAELVRAARVAAAPVAARAARTEPAPRTTHAPASGDGDVAAPPAAAVVESSGSTGASSAGGASAPAPAPATTTVSTVASAVPQAPISLPSTPQVTPPSVSVPAVTVPTPAATVSTPSVTVPKLP